MNADRTKSGNAATYSTTYWETLCKVDEIVAKEEKALAKA